MYSKYCSKDFQKATTVKLVYTNHLLDAKIVAVVDKCSLFKGASML